MDSVPATGPNQGTMPIPPQGGAGAYVPPNVSAASPIGGAGFVAPVVPTQGAYVPPNIAPVASSAAAGVPYVPPNLTSSLSEAELAEKKRLAMLAMEGTQGKLHREAEERKQQEEQILEKLRAEKTGIMKMLEDLAIKKEKLELKWVEMNEVKMPVDQALAPVIAEENKIEQEEYEIEKQEHSAVTPKDKQVFEKKRWEVDDKRRAAEKNRWALDDQIAQITEIIDKNANEYRELLTQEEGAQRRLDEINKSMAMYQ